MLVMDMKDINTILSRASLLNAKINDAIERAVKVDMSLSRESFETGTSRAEECGVEARNLISIRDALDVLEEQLECLQALQQQQHAEKEAALAELEESRRDLLGKLRNYEGREQEVVLEALAFAGETIDESPDLPHPPYSKLTSSNHTVDVSDEHPTIYYKNTDTYMDNGGLEQLAWREENYEVSISEVDNGSNNQIGEELDKDRKLPKKIMNIICSSVSRFMGSPVGKVTLVAAKAGLAVAGLLAVLSFSKSVLSKKRKQGIIGARCPPENSISSLLTGKEQDSVEEKCSGKVIIEDDMQKCFQEENTVIQSDKERAVPNVFDGRG